MDRYQCSIEILDSKLNSIAIESMLSEIGTKNCVLSRVEDSHRSADILIVAEKHLHDPKLKSILSRRSTNVIVLTSNPSKEKLVHLLSLGASDVIERGDHRLILARVKNLIYRIRLIKAKHTITIKGWVLDFQSFELLPANGPATSLTPLELNVLRVFFENFDEILSRKELYQQVYGLEEPAGTRKLVSVISGLRKKLVEFKDISIRTVHGDGYYLFIP